MQVELIAQGPGLTKSAKKKLGSLLKSANWSQLNVAAAYATVPGVFDLLDLIKDAKLIDRVQMGNRTR